MSSLYPIVNGPDQIKLLCSQACLQKGAGSPLLTFKVNKDPLQPNSSTEVQICVSSLRVLAEIADAWEFEGTIAGKEVFVTGLYASKSKTGNLSGLD